MSLTQNNAIGSGVLFPIALTTTDDGKQSWKTVTGDIELIKNNIRSIMLYQLGQMIRLEEFGNNLEDYLEEPNDQLLAFLVVKSIKSSINAWEPRLIPLQSKDITVVWTQTSIDISIVFKINGNQSIELLNFSYNLQTQNIDVIN